MPKRRDSITMNSHEMWDFIATQKSMHVCSLNTDGSPHLITMWFTLIEKKIILVSYSKSQKIVNLKRNPSIAILCESGTEYIELRGVSINSNAELITDPKLVEDYETSLILRNQAASSAAAARQMAASMSAKKTAILVSPEKIKTWDHSKLNSDY